MELDVVIESPQVERAIGELYHGLALSSSRLLRIGPITQAEAAEDDAPFCDGLGCYLYTIDASNSSRGITLIAKFLCAETAASFGKLLKAGLVDQV